MADDIERLVGWTAVSGAFCACKWSSFFEIDNREVLRDRRLIICHIVVVINFHRFLHNSSRTFSAVNELLVHSKSRPCPRWTFSCRKWTSSLPILNPQRLLQNRLFPTGIKSLLRWHGRNQLISQSI